MDPLHRIANTIEYTIFIAGEYNKAEQVARAYCDREGFCVTVSKTKYVYSFGEEEGIIVGLINYPRFPKTQDELHNHAITLANLLKDALNQKSFSIQGPKKTEWFSWREEDIVEDQDYVSESSAHIKPFRDKKTNQMHWQARNKEGSLKIFDNEDEAKEFAQSGDAELAASDRRIFGDEETNY